METFLGKDTGCSVVVLGASLQGSRRPGLRYCYGGLLGFYWVRSRIGTRITIRIRVRVENNYINTGCILAQNITSGSIDIECYGI